MQRGNEGLEALGVITDLQLQKARASEDLFGGALGAIVERVRGRVLDGADHEARGGIDLATRQVATLFEAVGKADQLRTIEVEDAARLGLVAGRHVVAR